MAKLRGAPVRQKIRTARHFLTAHTQCVQRFRHCNHCDYISLTLLWQSSQSFPPTILQLMKTLVGILAVGFIPAMIFAWILDTLSSGFQTLSEIQTRS